MHEGRIATRVHRVVVGGAALALAACCGARALALATAALGLLLLVRWAIHLHEASGGRRQERDEIGEAPSLEPLTAPRPRERTHELLAELQRRRQPLANWSLRRRG